MYNWIDGRKFSGPRNLPTISLISKNYVPFNKNALDLNGFNRLPVIKEEEGYVSDDGADLLQNYSWSNLSKASYVSQRTISTRNSSTKSNKVEKLKESFQKPFTRLPPLINVNCLMNTDIKQTQSIWDTKFGKRLIHGKNFHQNLSEIKDNSSNDLSSLNEKIKSNAPPKTLTKKNFLQENNVKKAGGHKKHFSKIKGSSEYASSEKKSRKTNIYKRNLSKRKVEENDKTKSSLIIGTKSREELSSIFSNQPQKASSSLSSLSRNQRFLTECVQTILDCRSNEIECEHCNESFSNIEELCKHKNQHEAEKEICLLCGKEFFNPNAFIQHLLTHEGVDRFTCKKCKTYFPSLKKYKHHCLDYHFTSSHSDYQNQTSIEFVKKWLPKYECKRCKTEFYSKEQQVAHRRNHIKMDLTGAYLLSPKNLVMNKWY